MGAGDSGPASLSLPAQLLRQSEVTFVLLHTQDESHVPRINQLGDQHGGGQLPDVFRLCEPASVRERCSGG